MSVLPDVSQPFRILTTPGSLSIWEVQFNKLAMFINAVVYDRGKDDLKLVRDLEFCESGSRSMLQVLLSHPDAILEEPIAHIGWEAVLVDYHQKSALQYLEQLKQFRTDLRMLLVNSPIKDNLPEYVKLLAFLNSGEQENGNYVDTAETLMMLEGNFKSHIAYERQADSSKILEHWVPAYVSQLQLQIYCSILLSNSSVLQSWMTSDKAPYDIIMSLSKCCDDRCLVDEFLPNPPVENHDHTDPIVTRVQACGKLLLLQKMLEAIRNKRLRVIILFQSDVAGGRSMGDILETVVRHKFGPESYERVECRGQLSRKAVALDKFNDKTKGRLVFLIETSACLPSIELSSVDAIIIYDQKALQKNKIESQLRYPGIFRLYTPFTIEEKWLVLAKQGMLTDDNSKDITHSVSHSLISWVASCLFTRLDELKHDKCASKSSERDNFMNKAISEFLEKVATDVGSTKINCTSISEANMSGKFYSRNITLIGEKEEMRALDGDPSNFWFNLLDGKSPCWSYISEPSQSSHKILQNMEERAEVPDEEANEDPPVGEITGPYSKSSPDNEHNGMLPENCSASSLALEPLDDTQQKSGVEKRMSTPKNLHVQLKKEPSKLIVALQLPDDVRAMAEQLFEYFLKNHLVVTEPVGILHAVIIALCLHAASVLKYKINCGELTALAGKNLNCECNEESAGFIYGRLRFPEERNPNRAIETSINGQPVSVEDTQISWEETSINMTVEKRMELVGNVFFLREKNIICKQQLEISGLDAYRQNNVIRLKEVCNLILEHIRRSHIDEMTRHDKIKQTVQWFTMLMYAFLEHMRLQHSKLEALQSDAWLVERHLKENLHQVAKSGQLDQGFDRHIAHPDSNFVMEESIHFKEQNDQKFESCVSDNQQPLDDGLLMEIALVRNEVLSGAISTQGMGNEPVATSVDSGEGPASEIVDLPENSINCSSDGMDVHRVDCSSSNIPANDDSVGPRFKNDSVGRMTVPGMKIHLLLLLVSLLSLLSAATAASEIPGIGCSGGNYTASRYQEVFQSLSVTLPWQVATSPVMFVRHTIMSAEATYALAQCRGDTDTTRCSICINEAIQKARASCGLRKEVAIFYNLCTLVISGNMIKWPSRVGSIVEQVDDTTVQSKAFDTGISALIAGVAGMAANMSGRFATAVKEINLDGTKYTAYGLAQCVPELTTVECGCCLEDLWSASSLTGWSGQSSTSPWCSYQFHLHKFFNGKPMQTFATLTSNALTA